MTKIKELLNKFKIWLGLLVTGLVIGFLVFRKHVGVGLEEQREQKKKEEEAVLLAQKKLEEEKQKLEVQKQEEEKKVELDNKQKLKEAVEKAKTERDRLKILEKRDPQGFVVSIERELGVKQKKKKGKYKKNE